MFMFGLIIESGNFFFPVELSQWCQQDLTIAPLYDCRPGCDPLFIKITHHSRRLTNLNSSLAQLLQITVLWRTFQHLSQLDLPCPVIPIFDISFNLTPGKHHSPRSTCFCLLILHSHCCGKLLVSEGKRNRAQSDRRLVVEYIYF